MKLLPKMCWHFPARTVNNLSAILMMERKMTATRANRNTSKLQNKMPQVVNTFYGKKKYFAAKLVGSGVVTLRMINLNT